jgi:holo-[acyl-carrier protein] synthase
VDLIEISRIEAAMERHGERFLNRVFTAQELAAAKNLPHSLAARFAAKEAAAKVLGCGIGQVGWQDIEIIRTAERRPEIILYGAAKALAEELGLREWAVSLSHTKDYAIASVVAKD